jgi:hypothetical protein
VHPRKYIASYEKRKLPTQRYRENIVVLIYGIREYKKNYRIITPYREARLQNILYVLI